MLCMVWDLLHTVVLLELDAPSTVLTFRNRFGFATIAETMDFSDDDSDYTEEASNEVNDGNKNSPSHTVVDVASDTYEESSNESEINDGTIGFISEFRPEPYTNLTYCLLTYCCLSSL